MAEKFPQCLHDSRALGSIIIYLFIHLFIYIYLFIYLHIPILHLYTSMKLGPRNLAGNAKGWHRRRFPRFGIQYKNCSPSAENVRVNKFYFPPLVQANPFLKEYN